MHVSKRVYDLPVSPSYTARLESLANLRSFFTPFVPIKIIGWAVLPGGFDRPLCPGEREREREGVPDSPRTSRALRGTRLRSRHQTTGTHHRRVAPGHGSGQGHRPCQQARGGTQVGPGHARHLCARSEARIRDYPADPQGRRDAGRAANQSPALHQPGAQRQRDHQHQTQRGTLQVVPQRFAATREAEESAGCGEVQATAHGVGGTRLGRGNRVLHGPSLVQVQEGGIGHQPHGSPGHHPNGFRRVDRPADHRHQAAPRLGGSTGGAAAARSSSQVISAGGPEPGHTVSHQAGAWRRIHTFDVYVEPGGNDTTQGADLP